MNLVTFMFSYELLYTYKKLNFKEHIFTMAYHKSQILCTICVISGLVQLQKSSCLNGPQSEDNAYRNGCMNLPLYKEQNLFYFHQLIIQSMGRMLFSVWIVVAKVVQLLEDGEGVWEVARRQEPRQYCRSQGQGCLRRTPRQEHYLVTLSHCTDLCVFSRGGIMAQRYRNEILKHTVRLLAGDDFILM